MDMLAQQAPEFELQDDEGKARQLQDWRGQKILLVFYPGDNTPVCTSQLCDYRDGISDFQDMEVQVLGISPDSVESHQQFKAKHNLPFPLLSDDELEVASEWGCKGLLGMKRAVFLLDEQHIVRYQHIESLAIFRRKKEELLEAISALESSQTGSI